jgi:hypothetical protein
MITSGEPWPVGLSHSIFASCFWASVFVRARVRVHARARVRSCTRECACVPACAHVRLKLHSAHKPSFCAPRSANNQAFPTSIRILRLNARGVSLPFDKVFRLGSRLSDLLGVLVVLVQVLVLVLELV